MYVFPFSARPCPSPIIGVKNVTVHTTNFLYGSMVTVHCLTGHRLPNNATTQSATCQIDSTWSATIAPCEGKFRL